MLTIKMLLAMAGKTPRKRRRLAKPTRPSRRAELAYKADLLAVVRTIRDAVKRDVLPVLQRTRDQYERTPKTADALTRDGFAGDILAAFDAMSRDLGGIDALAARLARLAVQRQVEETDNQLMRSVANALGISIDLVAGIKQMSVQNDIEAATLANVQLIKDIPRQAVEKLKNSVLNDVAMGRRYEDVAADIERQLDVTESRAKLIARDQMSKVNASITETKQTALGITSYQWSTSGDERVRESHRDKNGRIFRWDDPPGDTGHPGDDYQCRCVAIPVIDMEE